MRCVPLVGPWRGFTLIEVLTSIAVLTLLVVMVSQIINRTADLTEGDRKHMDSDGQARAVFDHLTEDLAGMVLRADADSLFVKSKGNDKLFIYSETPAYFSGSPSPAYCSSFSLIGYRVNAGLTPPLQLERLGKGLNWTGSPTSSSAGVQDGAPIFLTFPTPSAPPTPGVLAGPTPTPLPGSTLAGNWSATIGTAANDYTDGLDEDYRVVSSGVFRLEYCFLMKDGMLSTQPFTAPHTSPQGFQDVSAIIVAIAILDETSRKIIASTMSSQSAVSLVAALDDFTGVEVPATAPVSAPGATPPPAGTQLMGTRWEDQITTPGFAQGAGLPASVASKVRVYQRYFYLHTK